MASGRVKYLFIGWMVATVYLPLVPLVFLITPWADRHPTVTVVILLILAIGISTACFLKALDAASKI